MSDPAKVAGCSRVILSGTVASVELNNHHEVTGFVLETRSSGNQTVRFAETLYDDLPQEAESALPRLLALGKRLRVAAFSCSATTGTIEADEIESSPAPIVVPRNSTVTDLTGASEGVLQWHVGERVTMKGTFSLRGKIGPFIRVGGRPIYLESQRSISWGETYAKMEGKQVVVTGTLRFVHHPVEPSAKDMPVGRAEDHFYFDAETATVMLRK